MGRLLLTEQLRRKGFTIESAKALNSSDDPLRWLKVIRWTDEAEANDFKDWAITQIMTRSNLCGTGRHAAEEAFLWWDFAQGIAVGPLPHSTEAKSDVGQSDGSGGQ
jgi:hypothetical protein